MPRIVRMDSLQIAENGFNTHIEQLPGRQKKVTWFRLYDPEAKIQVFWAEEYGDVCEV